MKKMLTRFLVLFAVCSLSLTLVPSAHSQTSNIKVLNYSHYIDSLGYLVVVGEIQNIGTNTITSVVLTGAVTSSDGSITNSYAQVWVSNLIPQQKAPFYMEFNSQSGVNWQTDITDIAIAVYQADATANYLYPDLTITSQVGSVSPDGVFWVNGQIQNTGSQTAKNVTIVGTFYNSTGQVVAVGYSDKTTMNPFSLEPQQSGTFKLGAFDLNQTIVPAEMKISTYSLLIQPLGPILTGAAPVIPVTATPPPITVATPGPTSSQSGSNPSGSTPQWIYGAVAVIAIAVVAVAILTLMNRKKPQLATQTKNKPAKTPKQPPKPSRRPNR